ncbi:SH3 domain-containing protein [Acetobacter sp.]|jgi:SH3-like domain-containing protein|uniref:SH3 domain-containing protein n=1 Tax=Acetobacter sp. TaxID=440 RepID=UPI0025C56B05|nr:SH3 domain-containing protein [Acetobacter sp.]MCH4092105.1 RNA-binding protein [Acetobacter sp.]MCI1299978.1 SH3 domain-containing protein [Acetobacter sp.]MCI1315996.1 SH3 domain-containing protein [Acetobacter sp.]
MKTSIPLRVAATLVTVAATLSATAVAYAATADQPAHHHKSHAATAHKAAKKATHTEAHSDKAQKGHHAAEVKAHGTATAAHHRKHEAAAATREEAPHKGKTTHKAHPAKHVPHGAAPAGAVRPVPAPAALPAETNPTAPPSPDDASAGSNINGQDPTKGSNTGLPLPRFAALRADDVNMRAGPGQRYPIQWVYHRRGLPVQIEREFDVWRLVEDSDGVKGWVHQATLIGSRDFAIPSLPGTTPPAAETEAKPAADAAVGGSADGQKAEAQKAGTQKAEAPAANRHTESKIISRVSTSADVAKLPGAVILHSSADNESAAVAVLTPGTVGTIKACASGSSWCKVAVQRYEGWIHRSQMWGIGPDEAYPPS